MTTNPSAGDIVYSATGRAAEYIAYNNGMHIVRSLYGHEDHEIEYGDVEEWQKCFLNADTACEKLETRVADLDSEIHKKRQELNSIQSQIYEANKDEKERISRLKQHEALAYIDDYLDGQITHYVAEHDYYGTYAILPFDAHEEDYGRGSTKFRMLSLVPTKNWQSIAWVLSGYHDGGGSSVRVWPCKSEAEATVKAKELLQIKLDAELEREPSKRRYQKELFECCKTFGVAVPNQLTEDLHQQDLERKQIAIEKAKTEVEKLTAEIAALSK